MVKKHKILFTGITGAVGSWVAGEALRRGHSIVAVMRDENSEIAENRLIRSLDVSGNRIYSDSAEIIKGDICEDMTSAINNINTADISMIFHCAASTEFSDNNTEQSLRANVEGTKNILKLAEKLDVPVCYISTAYIAGKRNGIIKEDEIDVGQAFNNIYEKTKCDAERLVHNWSDQTGLNVFVFRPSIVIGDSNGGKIATFNGMYNMLRFFDTAGGIIGNEEIRAVANADKTKNFIPVDYLSKAIWDIIDAGAAGTYHITNPRPMALGQLRDIYERLFNIKVELVNEEEFAIKKPSRAERLYRKASSLYSPYLTDEPVFDRTNIDAVLDGAGLEIPAIDYDYFARLLEYAKSVQWGQFKLVSSGMSVRSASSIESYFNEFLHAKMNKQLLPDLRKLTASFRIVIEDHHDMYWSLAIEKGVLKTISRNGMLCDCSFVIGSDTFGDITSARITPQKAFFNKKVDINGNVETGLKLVNVLAAFFKRYPFEAEAVVD